MHLFGFLYSLCPWSRRHTQYTAWQNAKQVSETAGETPGLSMHINTRMFSLTMTLLAFQMGECATSYQECKNRSHQSVVTQMILRWSLPFWQGNGKLISTAVDGKTFRAFKNQKTVIVGDRRMDDLWISAFRVNKILPVRFIWWVLVFFSLFWSSKIVFISNITIGAVINSNEVGFSLNEQEKYSKTSWASNLNKKREEFIFKTLKYNF